jgi:hypothetical protein
MTSRTDQLQRAVSPSEIVLESDRKLIEFGKDGLAGGELLPKRFLRWVAQEIGASSIAIYIYGRDGLLAERHRWGKPIPGPEKTFGLQSVDIERLRSAKATEGRVVVAALGAGYRWRNALSPVFGFMVIYRATGISEDERANFADLSRSVAAEMERREREFALRRCERARRAIEKLVAYESRPGTSIAAAIRRLCKVASASYGGFGLIESGMFRLLYVRTPHVRGNATYVESSRVHGLSRSLLRDCSSGRTAFLDVRSPDCKVIADILDGYGEIDSSEYRFIVAPVAIDGEPIAAFAMGLSKQAIEHHDEQVLELASFCVEQLTRDICIIYAGAERMIIEPVFSGRSPKVESKDVFVLMPFTADWSARIWEHYILPVCHSEGFSARRANDLFGRDIMEDIWNGICAAGVVIADITGRNPNVFYELGIAHTLGKNVVLMAQDVNDIPFDLNRYRHIIYADNYDGYEMLTQKLILTLRELDQK